MPKLVEHPQDTFDHLENSFGRFFFQIAGIAWNKSKEYSPTAEEKAYNHVLHRVHIEYAIAKFKSLKMLNRHFCYPKSTYAIKLATITGIVNLATGF